MNKFLEILIGLIFLVIPIYVWIVNWADFGLAASTFLKGGFMWILLGIGAIFLLIGLNELKD